MEQSSKSEKIVIVGGVAGGASAAARARRVSETASITLFERGRHVSFANCGLPYHIGETIKERERLLVQTPESLRKRYRLDVRTRCEVLRIDRARKEVVFRDLDRGGESSCPYDKLILSPGAEPVRLSLPGADGPRVYTLRNLEDMDRIKQAVDTARPERAAIMGGGYIGLEMAEALRQRGVAVSLVELAPQVFTALDAEMLAPVHQQLELHGVELLLGTSVTAMQAAAGGLVLDLSTGKKLACQMVIMAVGVRPEIKLAREAGLVIGPSGGIVVNERLQTSDPDIFAVGDAAAITHFVSGRQAVIPLAGPANRQGRIAADNALGRDSVYRKTQGTAICKVFDLAIGMTGLGEKALKKAGRAYEKVYVHPANHAGYYPGASQISLKLLFDPGTGKILGAQAVGGPGVDKRIDVLATALRAGMTVEDLSELELAYAPPYGSAKDPVNYAGFVASNLRNGDMPTFHYDQVAQLHAGQVLLDVRAPAEVAAGTIPGARALPLDELRGRLGELPRDQELLVFCQVGLRGYLACRILMQHGFRCRNLSGGYKTWKAGREVTGDRLQVIEKQKTEKVTGDRLQVTDNPKSKIQNQKSDSLQPPASSLQPKLIDAQGLCCPGPIMRLHAEIEKLAHGEALSIVASDPAFPADVQSWCHSTGHRLAELLPQSGATRATIVKNAAHAAPETAPNPQSEIRNPKSKTIVLFSGDFDKAMAAFIIANGAAAMGSSVTMFFTFWGLNVLRRAENVRAPKNLIERMFGAMMPRGADKLGLSKMNMGGLGLRLIKGIMRKKHVPALSELIASARAAGVRLVACSLSMDLMGLGRAELLDGIEEGGVAAYLDQAEQGNVNLFI